MSTFLGISTADVFLTVNFLINLLISLTITQSLIWFIRLINDIVQIRRNFRKNSFNLTLGTSFLIGSMYNYWKL
jgi:hypothetical protein